MRGVVFRVTIKGDSEFFAWDPFHCSGDAVGWWEVGEVESSVFVRGDKSRMSCDVYLRVISHV